MIGFGSSRQAIHYSEHGRSIFDTVCGRRAKQTNATRLPSKVTCKLCIRWMEANSKP